MFQNEVNEYILFLLRILNQNDLQIFFVTHLQLHKHVQRSISGTPLAEVDSRTLLVMFLLQS